MQSASSLQGYGTFRAGVLKGNDSAVVTEPKTSTAQRKPNRWTDTPDKQTRPDVPPKPTRSRNPEDVYNQGSDRSSSPKPLTSNPPSSVDVRKPLPKTPVTNPSPLQNGGHVPVPNYENQSELNRFQQQETATSDILPPPPPSMEISPHSGSNTPHRHSDHSQKDKKAQQFSLRAWLKREKEQVRRGVESDSETSPESKPQSSRSFSKFKNSMMQKFTSGSTPKKHDNSGKRAKETKQPTSPPGRYEFDTPPAPYDALRNNYQQRVPIEHYKQEETRSARDPIPFPSVESDYNRSVSDQIISPIDDPDADDIITPEENRYEQHNGVPPQMRSKAEEINTRLNDSDVNNNDKFGAHDKFNSPATWQARGDDGPYGRVLKDRRAVTKDVNTTTNGPEYIGSGAESKCVVSHAAPVYKARVINNYENQGKFENPNILRQHAEPAKLLHENDFTNNQKYGTPTEAHIESTNPYIRHSTGHNRARSSDDVLQDRQQPAYQGTSHRHNASESSPYGQTPRSSRSVEKHSQKPETPRKRAVLDSRNFLTPGNRAPMNVHSIGSLIDKFDKCNNNSNLNEDVKPETMTSTPVASRKAPVVNGDVTEASPPLPPRSPSKSNRSGSTPNDSINESRKSSRYTSPDRQSYYTPQSRLNNPANNSHMSPPSVYSTPQEKFQPTVSNQQLNQFTPQSNTNSRSNTYFSPPVMNGDTFNDTRYKENGYSGHVINNNTLHSNSNIPSQSEDRDDGYRAKLRRAANSQSAFDRYSKVPPQYTGRPSFGSPYEASSHPYGSPPSVKSPIHNNEEVSYMAI